MTMGIKYEYQVWEVNKKIQKNVKAFSLEGGFLFFLMAWLIICFIILMVLRSLFNVYIASVLSITLFLIVAGVCSYFSQRYGIRKLIEKIGAIRQPKSIFSKHKHFKLNKDVSKY